MRGRTQLILISFYRFINEKKMLNHISKIYVNLKRSKLIYSTININKKNIGCILVIMFHFQGTYIDYSYCRESKNNF